MLKNVAFLYGHRPQHPDIWFLSAYEFMVYWRIEIASFNRGPEVDADNPGHCLLTACGQQKVYAADGQSGDGKVYLKPGVYYNVREKLAQDGNWLPLPDKTCTA